MTLITDEHTEHISISPVCDCEPFEAVYEMINGVLVCLSCHLPRPVVLHPDDVCEVCGGRGCTYCNSWGCMP